MQKAIFGTKEQKLVLHNFELDCYVLDTLIRVVEKTKFEKILGLETKSKTGLLNFFSSLSKYTTISEVILQKVNNLIAI